MKTGFLKVFKGSCLWYSRKLAFSLQYNFKRTEYEKCQKSFCWNGTDCIPD